jgi:hypothetical protein
MDESRSKKALAEFLDYLGQKGLMSPITARARKVAVNAVFSILDDAEARDVISVNLDDAMQRFGHLQGKEYTPGSLQTYKARVRAALHDFENYLQNPLAFRPSVQSRERKTASGKVSVTKGNQAQQERESTPETPVHRSPAVGGPMGGSIFPIPIRKDLTVFVQGLPFDLTEAEARKIASVIQAMAIAP